MNASGQTDLKLVIAKSGSRYDITITGTAKLFGSSETPDYKVTYKGTVRKIN
jgi:hypothetical protein